jgi:two-component system phosphate regulon response regulator PhoB
MRKVDILLTRDIAGGREPFRHDDLAVSFHLWSGGGAPLAQGRLVAFIDWSLPEIPGLELCRRLRCNPDSASALIYVVLESDHPDDRRRAVRAGANDCLIGPLSRTAILDRVLALPVEEIELVQPKVLSLGELVVDSAAFQARWRGKAIPLMPNEFRLLRFLVEHPGRVFTRTQLIEALGKQEPPIDERTVDVWIGRLRRALTVHGAGNPLRTVRGMGYVMDLPELT